jgi:hypothetical protein
MLTGIPAGVLLWRSRQTSAAPATAVVGAAPSSTAVVSARPASIPIVETAPAAKPAPATGDAAAKSPGPKAPAETPVPATATVAGPGAARSDLPVAIFGRIKLLTLGDKPRDRDATLRLASDGFEVLDGSRALEGALWQDVIGLYYSHSKEPRWTNADGLSAQVARAAGGGFGFLKGTPDWITLRTRRNFVSLRVHEDDVSRLARELEARTGAKIVTAK